MDPILMRKSVRVYADKPISEADLKSLLHAGMSAPTAMNHRPWRFVLVKDKAILKSLVMDGYTKALESAQAAIVIAGDKTKDETGILNMVDCALAAENILIEAASKGLGSVYYVVNPMDYREAQVRKVLNLPDTVIPYVVLPLGYPEKPLKEENRYDETMVHVDRW
jgi:nitroreductase